MAHKIIALSTELKEPWVSLLVVPALSETLFVLFFFKKRRTNPSPRAARRGQVAPSLSRAWIRKISWSSLMPSRVGCTGSLQIFEIKRRKARSVWGDRLGRSWLWWSTSALKFLDDPEFHWSRPSPERLDPNPSGQISFPSLRSSTP